MNDVIGEGSSRSRAFSNLISRGSGIAADAKGRKFGWKAQGY